MKHAILLALLDRLQHGRAAVEVIDTHAGAGMYDLQGEAAKASGEAEAGVVRLMGAEDAPSVFAPLKAAVRAANPHGGLRVYPGSPALILSRLWPGDSYTGCELRPDDFAALQSTLAAVRLPEGARAEVLKSDGYAAAARLPPTADRRRLILIDPPFERGDEYAKVVEAVAATLDRRGRTVHAVWTPLKDLETFDALLRELERLALPPTLAAQVRLRPLTNPMRMNGCAMIVAGCPQVEAEARDACEWVARALGEAGAAARVERIGG